MSLRSGWTLCVIFALAMSLAPFALGQATVSFAQLNGTVLDASGRTVVGASITQGEDGAVARIADQQLRPGERGAA